jgi:hypothetical protein
MRRLYVMFEVCESKMEHNFFQKLVPIIFIDPDDLNLTRENFCAKLNIFIYLTALCKSKTKIHGQHCCVSTTKWLIETAN